MSRVYKEGTNFGSAFNIQVAAPIDLRTVVETHSDLLESTEGYYTGLLVYVADEKQLYVFTASNSDVDDLMWLDGEEYTTTLDSYWIKVGSGSEPTDSVKCNYVVSSVDELTDGSIEGLGVGNIAYVKNSDDDSSNGLYILVADDASVGSNWVCITGSTTNIEVRNTDDVLRDYVSKDDPISSDTFYTSMGLNTYEDSVSGEEYIVLSNGGASYVKLFNGDEGNWIEMNIVDDSLGFTLDDVKVKSDDGTVSGYVNGTALPNGTLVSFGKDVDFTGFVETRPDGSKHVFGEDGSGYDDVDIYKETDVVEVFVNKDGDDVRLLSEFDKEELDDKISSVNGRIDNIYNTLLIDPDGDGEKESSTLQEVIVNMNNAITKLESIDISPISDEFIYSLFDDEETEDINKN